MPRVRCHTICRANSLPPTCARRCPSSSAAHDEMLSSVLAQGVETPGPRAGEGQIEEHEAEQDRQIAAIEDGQETPGGMSEKIGKCHLARENECNGTGEKAQDHQGAANE